MATIRLMQNYVGPPGTVQKFQVNWGIAFSVTIDAYITHLHWWNIETDNRKPDALSLYQVGNTSALAQVVPAPQGPSGAARWETYTIPAPVRAEAGTLWIVSAHYPGDSGSQWRIPWVSNAALPNTPTGINFAAQMRRELSGGIAYPTTATTDNIPLLDVTLDTDYDPSNPGGITTQDISAALSSWLHSTANDFPTVSTPYLTWLLANAIDTAVADTKEMVEGLVAIGIGAKLGDAETALDGLEQFLYSVAPDSLKSYLDGLSGGIRGEGAPTIADVVTAVGNIPTATSGTPRTVGLAGWTQAAQTVGDGSFQWNQAADAYVFHTEVLTESARFAQAIGSGVAHWFRGWAKPWDGANYYPPRLEIVGLDTVIHDGQRWPGVALWVPPDVEWTLTAYDYTPA